MKSQPHRNARREQTREVLLEPDGIPQYVQRINDEPRDVTPHPSRYAWQEFEGVEDQPEVFTTRAAARNELDIQLQRVAPKRNQRPTRQTFSSSLRRRLGPKRSEVGVCTKYLIFIVNFLLFIVGAAMLTLSVYILVLKEKVVHDALDFFLDPSCLLCLAGSLLTLVSSLGGYGSLRENTTVLKMYYYSMLLLFFLEVTGCVLLFVSYYSPDLKEKMFPTDTFNHAIVRYRDDIDMENLIDTIQRELKCCGMSDSDSGFLDWTKNRYFNCSSSNFSPEKCAVPSSCCKPRDGQIMNHQCGWNAVKMGLDGAVMPNDLKYTTNIYTLGCLKALGDWINQHALVLGGVLLGILLPQVFLLAFTSNLTKMILRQRSRWSRQ